MSKWLLFPGLGLLVIASLMFVLQGLFPVLADWYWLIMQIGIVLTIAGSAILIFRGDW